MKTSTCLLFALLAMPLRGWGAGPVLFDVNLDITLGDSTSNTKVTVEEGAEGSVSTFADDRTTRLSDVRVTVVSTGARTSTLTLKITDGSGRTTESLLELRDGQQGTLSGGTAAQREIKATITRLGRAAID